ncbi:olfactory receptor 14A16-like [Orycteropus afer afer]|uniref:Olfactory receptor n=1 Tax=Orycteropus afer afer TaxID=1230840 RepID=A0A8B7BCA0_ORYAF|nr:olfactory receptor 14A16-like [Orycteropus afer afer]
MPQKITNITMIMEFLLMGFPDDWMLQRLYVVLFFFIYLTALMGNFLIVTLTTTDRHLQAPMYFFLRNLSLIDICYISVTVPKSILNCLTHSYSISFLGCVAQVFLVMFLAGTEYALLIVMSYDRFAAICQPLHYETIMNRGACVQMASASWLSGCIYGCIHVAGTFSVNFCGPNLVHQFFCDIPSLLTLTCSGKHILEHTIIIASCCFSFACFILIIVSYVNIFSAVLKISTNQGRLKTFSTSMPHLTVVTLFLSSGIIAYIVSALRSPSSMNLFISVLYSLVPPTLNPVIYSLRNRDMKVALGKMFGGKWALRFKCLKY